MVTMHNSPELTADPGQQNLASAEMLHSIAFNCQPSTSLSRGRRDVCSSFESVLSELPVDRRLADSQQLRRAQAISPGGFKRLEDSSPLELPQRHDLQRIGGRAKVIEQGRRKVLHLNQRRRAKRQSALDAI